MLWPQSVAVRPGDRDGTAAAATTAAADAPAPAAALAAVVLDKLVAVLVGLCRVGVYHGRGSGCDNGCGCGGLGGDRGGRCCRHHGCRALTIVLVTVVVVEVVVGLAASVASCGVWSVFTSPEYDRHDRRGSCGRPVVVRDASRALH